MNENTKQEKILALKKQCKIDMSELTDNLYEEIEKIENWPKMNTSYKKTLINRLNSKYREKVTNILTNLNEKINNL